MTFTPTPASTPRSASGSVTPSVPITRSRRQPVILRESTKSTARFGEIAGSNAADCAVICCCLPCGIVSLIVCAVVKLPVGICRRAYLRRRRRRIREMRKKATQWDTGVGFRFDDGNDLESVRTEEEWGIPTAAPSPEMAAMEREMWARFCETGFGRSPSQRENL